MTRPTRFLVRMAIFLLLVVAVAVLLFAPLFDAFMANAALNGMILATLAIGILYIVRQVVSLGPEVSWIESYRTSQPGLSMQQAPTLLAPVATMLGERRDERVSLSAMSLRSLLDSIDARLDESRDISRYIIGLLIFLGLLGTFWGLLQTVGAVGDVINSLSVGSGDLGTVFDDLKSGLESPLGGMATAFSSSLFGLAGSLILGFMELQLGQAQNRFYNDLEEWLSGLTRLSSGGGVLADGEHSASAYQTALWEQTADSLDKLQRVILRSEDDRRQANANLMALNEKLGTLVDQMRAEQDLMVKLGEAQLEIRPVLAKIAEGQTGGRDELMRTHLRNIEAYVARLVEEASEGRNRTVEEIRQEIRLVARTIAALAEEER
ncbi:MotA/TolQ/ExbB proton channel family protein [Nisaea sp.]|uniref:MotA/TolQ/ExbB proton channel family protein n=1 Tax=Nisaea sp. TaxID=2024842 RepID=UPI0025FF0EB1|nr:MotA/TolQ/ExbB proton channel family protein [Nisaea sp.]